MGGGTDVVAVLPRGEAIRTHAYSGALDAVGRQRTLRVVSVLPNDQVRRYLEDRYGDVVPLVHHRERGRARILRELMELAHGRALGSEAARERARRRDMEATTLAALLKRRIKVAAARPFARPTVLARLDSLYERAAAHWRTSDEPFELLASLEPRLVFNGSHVHSRNAEPIIIAARQQGIPTIAFLFSWDNLSSQGRIVPRYDRFLAWNDQIKHDLLRIYPAIGARDVVVTGTPQFDFHFWPELRRSREDFCADVGADPERPIVLYSTGMPNHMPGEQDIVEDLADRLRRMRDLGSPQLLVRLYAKDRTDRFDDLRRRRDDIVFPPVAWEQNWLTPLPEDTALWTNMLLHADVGVNVASTVSLELCMFDKPVVNVSYNPPRVDRNDIDYGRYYSFDHYRPVVASGGVRLARSPEELAALVRGSLEQPHDRSAQRKALLDTMFGGTLDGHSADRVADALVRFAA